MARGDGLPTRGGTGEAQAMREMLRMRESLEKLTGERGDANKSQSAVRRMELLPLASMKMQSTQVAGAPTQAEFNALQTDVANIFAALQRISNRLGNATLPKP